MPPLNHYASLLLRRLPVLLAGLVIGGVVGWLTTPDATGVDTTPVESTFRATHTLVADDPGRTVNLDQLAFLAVVGSVPRDAAQDLGATPAELTSHLQITVRADIQALQMTAYAEDGQRAAAIADRFAQGLLDLLDSQRNTRINDLSVRADALRTELAGLAPEQVVERQRVQDELDIVLEQFRTASSDQAPLLSVEPAQSVAIGGDAYTAAIERIRARGTVVSLGENSTGSFQLEGLAPPSDEPADEPAEAPRAAVGALVGLIAAAALVVALDRLDPRLRSVEDVEHALGAAVLAEIPSLDRSQRGDLVIVHREPHSRVAEAFRTLRTSIAPAGTIDDRADRAGPMSAADAGAANGSDPAGRHGAVVLVTSAEPGEGKTTTAVNLAAAFAETGKRVLVIDADFRKPRSQAMLRPQSSQTIADSLWPPDGGTAKTSAPQFASLVSHTDLLGVGLLRAGDERSVVITPSRLIVTVKQACTWAVDHFDVVVVDTAALLGVNDARDLLPVADAVVLAMRKGSATRDTAAHTGELLHRLAAPLAGVAFIGSTPSAPIRRSDFTRAAGPPRPTSAPTREPLGL